MGDGREFTEQDRVLYALCRPGRLLDLARRFTLFDLGFKKVARYQQFFAVKNILAKVKQRDSEGRRQGGVIWHTQGSGKSLTMVMLARALALDPEIINPRIVLVTDRIDLDEQLKATFAACGAEPENATSGRHLLKLVSQDRASIIATVATRSKRAALLYKRALDQIGMVTSEVIISALDDREGYDESREEVGRRVLVEPERSTSNSLQTWKVLLAGLTQSMYFSDRQAPEFQRQIISSAVDLGPQNL